MVASLFVAEATYAQTTKTKNPPVKTPATKTMEKKEHDGKGSAGARVERAKLTPEQRAQKGVDRLNESCGLTDSQKTTIYALNLERINKVQAIHTTEKGTRTAEERAKMRETIKPINQDYRTKVKALLTKEQTEKLKAKLKENKDKIDDEFIPVVD